MELLMEVMPMPLPMIIVFWSSQFTSMLKIIEGIKGYGNSLFLPDGSTTIQDRSEYVKKFNAGEGEGIPDFLKSW